MKSVTGVVKKCAQSSVKCRSGRGSRVLIVWVLLLKAQHHSLCYTKAKRCILADGSRDGLLAGRFPEAVRGVS